MERKKMITKGRWVGIGSMLALTSAIAAGAVCFRDKPARSGGGTAMAHVAPAAPEDDQTPPGLRFRLSEGKPPLGGATETIPRGEATLLSDAEADRILA